MSVPLAEEQVVAGADGTPIFVRTCGQPAGLTILLVHGYLFSSGVFARQFAGPLAGQYRLVAMDLRGHGRSGKPGDLSQYSHAQLWADDVARVVEACHVQEMVVVGWSMGARVALTYGWFHGFGRIVGLNLVSAVVAGPERGPGSSLPAELAGLLSEDGSARLRATRAFVSGCAGSGRLDRGCEDSFTRTAMSAPLVARRGSRAWPVHYEALLPSLRTPVLVTHGAGDRWVPESASRDLAAAVPSGSLSVIGGGHLPFLLDSDRYDRELAAFAERSASPRPRRPA